jgi:hypothetical protein
MIDVEQRMRQEAAQMAERLPETSDTRACLRELASSPGLLDEEGWQRLVRDAWIEIEDAAGMRSEGGVVSPMAPEAGKALVNAWGYLSEAELALVIPRMGAAGKAEGYLNFADFIFAKVKGAGGYPDIAGFLFAKATERVDEADLIERINKAGPLDRFPKDEG